MAISNALSDAERGRAGNGFRNEFVARFIGQQLVACDVTRRVPAAVRVSEALGQTLVYMRTGSKAGDAADDDRPNGWVLHGLLGVAGIGKAPSGEKTEYHVAIGDQPIQASSCSVKAAAMPFCRRSGAGAFPAENRIAIAGPGENWFHVTGACMVQRRSPSPDQLGINLAAQGDGKAVALHGADAVLLPATWRWSGRESSNIRPQTSPTGRRWLRVVNTGRKFSHAGIDGVDPFSKKRERWRKAWRLRRRRALSLQTATALPISPAAKSTSPERGRPGAPTNRR